MKIWAVNTNIVLDQLSNIKLGKRKAKGE